MASTKDSLFDVKVELSNGLQDKLARYINIRSFLILFALVFFLIAWNRGIALIYVMSALMLGVLLVSYLAPFLSLRGVSVRRETYLVAAVGQAVHVSLRLEQSGRGWGRMLEVIDRVPCAEEDSREPSVYVPRLHHSLETAYQVTMDWRGIHTLGPMELRSSYPLGVHCVRRTMVGSTATVLVHPTAFTIAQMTFDKAASRMTLGSYLSRRTGGSDEFSRLREYRSGDSVRHIHWAKSCQGRDLLVKQYETYENNIVSIVLDRSAERNIGEGRLSTFEYQVSIALSIARYCIDRGIPVALHDSGDYTLPAQSSESHYAHITEALALVQADDQSTSYARYVQTVVDDSPEGCWVLFANDDDEVLNSINYHSFVSQVTAIEFCSDSFRFPVANTSSNSPSPMCDYYISRNDDLERVFRR